MRAIVRLVAVLCCVIVGVAAARAEKRVALIVGNSSYAHIAGLPNVRNDAAAVFELLRAANFGEIDAVYNLNVDQLRRALKMFAGRAANADVAVLYYAGHGIEVGQTNYLIPVDARLASDFDVEDETVPLDRVLQAMEPARRLGLVILDACRENPFLKSMKRTVATRSVGRGLGRVEPTAPNTLIAFATKPNAVAEDGEGPNSPFTTALVKHLLTPGLDLRIALGKVRDDVLASTGGRQQPYVTSSLGGEIVAIVPGASGVALAPVQRPAFSGSRGSTPLTEVEERALKPKDTFKECTTCPEMVVVPAGEYLMGTSSDEIVGLTIQFFPGAAPRSADGFFSSEQPQHKVKIAKPFAVGKFEVTFAEWEACSAAGGCSSNKSPAEMDMGKGGRPVINVSWDDAKDYVERLSRHTGKTYRLLTEAEWEYVARAETTTNYAFGDKITADQARLSEGAPYSAGTTAQVGSFPANRFRLHDTHGNVEEWVEDCWNGNYRGAPTDGSAQTTGECDRRVLRGGNWVSNQTRHLRSASRNFQAPGFRSLFIGFRVARTL